MTKDALIEKAIQFKNDDLGYYDFIVSLNAYSAALLQQTPCSTLRELLEHMLNRLTEDSQNTDLIKSYRNECKQNIEFVKRVISLLDILQPVA